MKNLNKFGGNWTEQKIAIFLKISSCISGNHEETEF